MSDNKNRSRENISTFSGSGAKKLWSTDQIVRGALGARSQSRISRDTLAQQLANAKNVEELRKISINAKSNQGYADVINYYKSMYYYRYTVTPVNMKKATAGGKILETTREMLNLVETINLEAILPHILETGLFEGRVTLYIEKYKEGLVTHVLPSSHSESLLKSSYGTETVAFDLSYFDDLLDNLSMDDEADILNENQKDKAKRREDQRAELTVSILSYFPKEITDAYLLYAGLDNKGKKVSRNSRKPRGPQKIALKPESAAIIPFSASSAPPKINVTAAEENYKEVLDVQQKKNKAGLEKIFTHKIPIGDDGDLLLTVDEAADIQRAMESFLNENAQVTVVTTIGDTNLYDIQREPNEKSRAVSEAYDTQYESASINPQLFRANTDYALGVSLNRDAAFMWDILQKIMNFYNIVVNELFNFGDYKCQINLLPITVYNEADKVNEYRRMAEYGIGKLDAIIATGQKQISLLDSLELERELNLDELLTPLQSSHTRSSKEQGQEAKVDEKVKKKDDSKDEDDDQDPQEDDAEEVKNEED